jgi:hypothetical protein
MQVLGTCLRGFFESDCPFARTSCLHLQEVRFIQFLFVHAFLIVCQWIPVRQPRKDRNLPPLFSVTSVTLILYKNLKMCGSFFCRIYKGGDVIGADASLDYAANFAHMLGFDDELMHELMRLYLSIHTYFTTPTTLVFLTKWCIQQLSQLFCLRHEADVCKCSFVSFPWNFLLLVLWIFWEFPFSLW